jgi:hypothetical protein
MRKESGTTHFAGMEQAGGKSQPLAPTATIADETLTDHTKFKEPEPYQVFKSQRNKSFNELGSARKCASLNLTSPEESPNGDASKKREFLWRIEYSPPIEDGELIGKGKKSFEICLEKG